MTVSGRLRPERKRWVVKLRVLAASVDAMLVGKPQVVQPVEGLGASSRSSVREAKGRTLEA